MSIKVMTRVWDPCVDEKGSTLLLLLALADFARDDGLCWPSIKALAAQTRMSDRQVQRMLEGLEDRRRIYCSRNTGRGHSNHYVVVAGLSPQRAEHILRGLFPDEDERITLFLTDMETPLPDENGTAPTSQKGDKLSSFPIKKGDKVTPNTGIKGDKLSDRKGDILRRKGDISDVKGDIAMSNDPSWDPSWDPSSSSCVDRRAVTADDDDLKTEHTNTNAVRPKQSGQSHQRGVHPSPPHSAPPPAPQVENETARFLRGKGVSPKVCQEFAARSLSSVEQAFANWSGLKDTGGAVNFLRGNPESSVPSTPMVPPDETDEQRRQREIQVGERIRAQRLSYHGGGYAEQR